MTQAKLAQTVKMITVIASVLLFALICIVCYQYVRLNNLSSKNALLDTQIAQLSVTKVNLENGIEARSTDAYIEQQARENLGMIRVDGETIYVIE